MPNFDALLSLLSALLTISLILGLAYCFTRFVVGARGPLVTGMMGGGRLRVLDQLSLGREQRLMLVQVLEHYYLLGVAAGAVTLLQELSPDELDSWQKRAQEQGATKTEKAAPRFREELGELLRKRGRR